MPIRPELRPFYGPVWKNETRPAALERAGRRCQHCQKPDRAIVETVTGGTPAARFMVWRFPGGLLQPANPHGDLLPWRNRAGELQHPHYTPPAAPHDVLVVLTVAHLNHTAGDDRPENLRALCQWCHLVYDLEHHARTRAERKDAGRPLLTMGTR